MEKTRQYYYAAALVAVLLLVVVAFLWYRHDKKKLDTFLQAPTNPQPYEYRHFLEKRAALGVPTCGCPTAGCATGCAANCDAGRQETMNNTYHWDQMGTYQHTPMTWGLPPGNARPNYSGYSKENMVGAHWDQTGTYGHTGPTLPTYGYSGYYEDVPTPAWA